MIKVLLIVLAFLIGIFIGRCIGQYEFILKMTNCSKKDFAKIINDMIKTRIIIEGGKTDEDNTTT